MTTIAVCVIYMIIAACFKLHWDATDKSELPPMIWETSNQIFWSVIWPVYLIIRVISFFIWKIQMQKSHGIEKDILILTDDFAHKIVWDVISTYKNLDKINKKEIQKIYDDNPSIFCVQGPSTTIMLFRTIISIIGIGEKDLKEEEIQYLTKFTDTLEGTCYLLGLKLTKPLREATTDLRIRYVEAVDKELQKLGYQQCDPQYRRDILCKLGFEY